MTPRISLEHRLALYVRDGRPFTADDVTAAGSITLDAGHAPNAGQNGIGSLFRAAATRGLIEHTGQVVQSGAPHRKGGAIRVWVGTPAGRAWAEDFLGPR